LGTDILGMVWITLKVVLNPASITKLTPITQAGLSHESPRRVRSRRSIAS
jgi:hypothetical protein